MKNEAGGSALGVKVVYHAPLDVRLEQMDALPMVGMGEVLIKIETCAICGTDIKTYFYGNPRIEPPMTMGHEFCGRIVEVGAGVYGYQLGQRVTMATTIGCGECFYCRRGRTNLCQNAEAMGFQYPGAMASYIKIPAKAIRQKHLVDVEELNAEVAAISEPLSCVINNLSRFPHEQFESALVIGLGPLGMLHSLTLQEKGVKNICCVDFPGRRLEMMAQLGFTTVLPDEIADKYRALSNGNGFDLVVVTAPHNGTQGKAPLFARKGGYVSYFASLPVGDEMVQVNSRTIHYNELIVYGTSDSTVRHLEEAVKLLMANPDKFKPLITHVLPIKDFHKAMDEIKAGKAVKIVLVP